MGASERIRVGTSERANERYDSQWNKARGAEQGNEARSAEQGNEARSAQCRKGMLPATGRVVLTRLAQSSCSSVSTSLFPRLDL